jgi:hypothetical protein
VLGQHGLDGGKNLVFLADVAAVDGGSAAGVGDFALHGFELLGLAADQRDLRAEGGEFMGGAAADAAAAAGDDDALADEEAFAENGTVVHGIPPRAGPNQRQPSSCLVDYGRARVDVQATLAMVLLDH